jgi:hypothetical protein
MARLPVGFARSELPVGEAEGQGVRRMPEVVCAVLGEGDGRVAVAAFDLINLPTAACEDMRVEVGRIVGAGPERVLLHATHTHTPPGRWGEALSGAGREVLAACAEEAAAGARPASVRTGTADVGQRLSVCRRGDAGPDLGVQTFWFGYIFHEGDDRADASALANEMRARWLRQGPAYEPGPEPIWFDRPVDPFVQAMAFEDEDGETIGSIVRFCAHSHLASACRPRLVDPDYPAVVRDTMQAALGGTSMFLLGPSADLVPRERVRYVVAPDEVPAFPYVGPTSALHAADQGELLAEMARIGGAVGEAALGALSAVEAQPLERLACEGRMAAVPLNPDLPGSQEELSRMHALRRLASCLNGLEWGGRLALRVLTDEDRAAGEKPMPLSALRVNDTFVAFVHSEVSSLTSARLREANPGVDLWTVSLTNGGMGYYPTAEMIDEGGYEGRSTVVAASAEARLREHVQGLLDALR